jgi:uncharacterized protein (TIGR02597 family)
MHSSKRSLPPLFLTALLIISLRGVNPAVSKATVATDPVGFTTTSCFANSDTYMGIPFTRPPEFTGTIQSVSANTVVVNGNPNWSTNQFVYTAGTQRKHYYLLIGAGGILNPKEGHAFPVVANGANSLNVDTRFDNLSGITSNTQIALIPYWTPLAIFPATDAGLSFTPTTSSAFYKTQILVPNTSTAGTKLPYSAVYYFSHNVNGTSNNVGWRQIGDANTTDHGDDPMLPDSYFVVRNTNGAPTLPLTAFGSVLMTKIAVPLFALETGQQDNPIAMIRPVDVTLDATGLAPIDNSFTQNDQLVLIDSAQQFGKQPKKVYIYNDGWRVAGDKADHSKDVIPAGSALIVRKAASPGGTICYWLNSPTYIAGTSLSPLSAVSRKMHGGAGSFSTNLPAGGTMGIECRTPGTANSHQIIFTFANQVTLTGATITLGLNATGSISGTPIVSGNHVIVNLVNISNAQRLMINLSGVSDGVLTNDFSVPMGVLVGDVNATGRTDDGDAIAVRNKSGSVVDGSTFRLDVNCSGRIDGSDVIAVRNFLDTALPPN